jgi:hypothetical protein
MHKITQYQQIIQETLLAHSPINPAYGEIEIDLKGTRIWMQYDGPEVGVANKLVERGILTEDIGLADHSPFMRQYSSFAIG